MSKHEVNDQLIDWLSQESTENFLVEMIEQNSKNAQSAESARKKQMIVPDSENTIPMKQLFVTTDDITENDSRSDNLLSTAPHPLSPFSPTEISFPKHSPNNNNKSAHTLKHHQHIRQSLSPKASAMDLDATPPRSPSSSKSKSHDSSCHSPRLRSDSLANSNHFPFSRRGSERLNLVNVKQFYFPLGIPPTPNAEKENIMAIEQYFGRHGNKLSVQQLSDICTGICGISKYCAGVLFKKLAGFAASIGQVLVDEVPLELFMRFWPQLSKYHCPESRLYFLLNDDEKQCENNICQYSSTNYLSRHHFQPLVEYILKHHPGLTFLQNAQNFHRKYIVTVIERIFYELSASGCDGITLSDLKRSNLMSVLRLVDIEEDINDVFDYFSYEHFYVIYCKFWELDADHDAIIDGRQLEKYAEYSLTKRVVKRIMEGIPRKLRLGNEKKQMCYEDFIPFIIAEEDKKNPVSVEYWFRVLDLDGDGVLSPYEIKYFYDEQASRIRRISRDVIDFRDFLCQLNDMIHPEKEAMFSLRDLKRSKLCHLFFNMLFNLNKFALHEQRDPFLIEEIRNTPQMTDWDRFASSEYARYVDEDGFDSGDEE